MTIATVSELVGVVTASRLLEQGQQQALVGELQREFTDASKLARAIVKRGWLTAFQIKMLANNRGADLVLGQYLLLDILGEGGMGQVFKARQRKLDRIVALKVIRKERLSNPDAVRRFQREMLAASQLSHPNIVLAFDAGEAGDRQFIVMEYIEGVDLGKRVKQQGALAPAQACDYAAQAASGLQHAHERGLVHRDIKPSNLLVSTSPLSPGGERGFGLLKILDMGLARATENSELDMSGTLTQAGAVVGTPDYISPEQARDSRGVDIRSDLYSLGCTLYFLLTARVPFPGGTGMEKLFKHQLESPTPVEQLRPDLPRGVADVVARLMAKDPAQRPQTPADAARLLLPLAAQPRAASIQPAPQASSQPAVSAHDGETADAIRRKRTSGLAGAVAPVPGPSPIPAPARRPLSRRLVIGLAASFVVLVGIVYFALSGLSSDTGRPPESEQAKDSQRQPPDKPKSPLDQLAASQIPAADRWPGMPAEVVAVLGEHRFRHWGPVNAGAISPDGKWLATVGGDRFVRVWNIATGEQRTAWPLDVPGLPGFLPGSSSIAFMANGQGVIVICGNQMLKAWEIQSGRVLVQLPSPKLEGRPVSLSPNGQTVLWQARDGIKLLDFILQKDQGEVKGLTLGHVIVWSADGKTFASWTRNGRMVTDLSVWDINGQLRHTIPLPDGMASNPVLSPDGHRVAVVILTKDNTSLLKIWNTTTGEELVSRKLAGPTFQIAFVPGGKYFVLGSGNSLLVHDIASGQDRSMPLATVGGFAGMFFSPDGRIMGLLNSWEPLVRLYDIASGKQLHPSEIFIGLGVSQVFTPDGRALIAGTGFARPGVRVIDLPSGKVRTVLGETQPMIMLLGTTPDSKTVLTRAGNGLMLWDLTTGTAKQSAPVGGQLLTVACTPDCSTVFTSGPGGGKVWDGTTLQPRGTLDGLKGQLFHVSLSADGKRLVTGEFQADGRGRIRLWDPVAAKEIPFNGQPVNGPLMSVVMSPDGKWLAASTMGGMRIWDETGHERLTVLVEGGGGGPPQTFGYTMVASPTGDGLLAWNNRQIKLCDPVAGKERATLTGHPDGLTAAVFRPDGKLLATADRAGRVILWNAATGSETGRITMPGGVVGLSFAPDGRHLATTNTNGTVYILRLAGS